MPIHLSLRLIDAISAKIIDRLLAMAEEESHNFLIIFGARPRGYFSKHGSWVNQ